MPGRYFPLPLFVLLLLCLPAPGLAQTRVLVTGEWPPYTGVKEPQGGSMTATVRAAYAALGDDVRVGFFDWPRIKYLPQENDGYSGSFPHYYSEERSRRCHFSDAIGASPVGLVVRQEHALQWQKMEDLAAYRIGTVSSYVNTPEFDRLVVAGRIKTLSALTDAENLRNLLTGKVDAVVIDRNVYAYLLDKEAFHDEASQLQMDPHLLILHRLYVCFPRTQKGRAARDYFNRGLRTLQAPSP